MRKLAFLTLGMYLSVMLSAVALGASSVPIKKICSSGTGLLGVPELTARYNGGEEETAVLATVTETYSTYAKSIKYLNSTCGTKHDSTGMFEMGDCSAKDDTTNKDPKIVTEITEAIGGEIELGDDKIIELYKGICCLAGATIPEQAEVEEEIDENGKVITEARDAIPEAYYCDSTRNVYYETYTECTTGAQSCQKVQWLISSTGAGILKTYVKQIYVFGAGIVGFIAVATIVGSGIQISVSGATGDITEAKDRITQSIMGIALLFLSALILYTINPTFFF